MFQCDTATDRAQKCSPTHSDSASPDRVAGLEDEHGAGGVPVPVQALLPLPHPGPGGAPGDRASKPEECHLVSEARIKLPLRLQLIPRQQYHRGMRRC